MAAATVIVLIIAAQAALVFTQNTSEKRHEQGRDTQLPIDDTAEPGFSAIVLNLTAAPGQTTTSMPANPRDTGPSRPPQHRRYSFQAGQRHLSFMEKQRYAEWGLRHVSLNVEFPTEEYISISTEAMVRQRNVRMAETILPGCYGVGGTSRIEAAPSAIMRNARDMTKNKDLYAAYNRTTWAPPLSSVAVADFAMVPLGCFGDVDCGLDSCLFGESLANFTYCGAAKFGAFLGDNFYLYGIDPTRPERFDIDLFARFFRFEELRMRFYAVVGNHDGVTELQIRKPGEHPFWYMPSLNYTTPLHELNGTTIQSFMVDTHLLGEGSYETLRNQSHWLDDALTRSRAQWKVLMTHEPMFSFNDGFHNPGLVDFVLPVAIKHRVQLFIAAHEHGIYLHKIPGGTYQLVSAGIAVTACFGHRAIRRCRHEQIFIHPRRPTGYYHIGRGNVAILFTKTHADVYAFSRKGLLIFSHRIPVEINETIQFTEVTEGHEARIFDARESKCALARPLKPNWCSKRKK
jgi:hypothetical protein